MYQCLFWLTWRVAAQYATLYESSRDTDIVKQYGVGGDSGIPRSCHQHLGTSLETEHVNQIAGQLVKN